MVLYAKVLGEGNPLIVLPGLLGMSDNWLTFSKQMANKFKLYLLDLRNHGRSFHSEVFNYTVMAADIQRFIQHNKLQTPIILGHSMGGKVAMQFAQHYPQHVSKLIVVDITPAPYSSEQRFGKIFNKLKTLVLKDMSTRAEIESFVANFFPDKLFRQFLMKNIYRTDQGNFAWRFNLSVIANHMQEVGKPIDFKAPCQIPTLFVRGSDADYVHAENLKLVDTLFTNYILKTIPDAGHWVHYDQPALFCKVVEAFLSNTTAMA